MEMLKARQILADLALRSIRYKSEALHLLYSTINCIKGSLATPLRPSETAWTRNRHLLVDKVMTSFSSVYAVVQRDGSEAALKGSELVSILLQLVLT